MSRGPVLIGAGIGLLLAVVVLAVLGPGGAAAPAEASGPVVSDCDGPLRELVIQYVPEAAAIVAPVYADFLPQLPADVTVYVVCPNAAGFDDLKRRVGRVQCRLRRVAVAHPMTAWARDRWLATAPAGEGGAITLFRPRNERGAAGWPERAGDERIAADLAAALGGRVATRRSGLLFDAGDFVADARSAFVTPEVALRNLQHTVRDRVELLRALEQMCGREVVLLAAAPPHHAGMYMMPIGGGRVIVGDPALALEALGESDLPPEAVPCGADFRDRTQRLFDAVAAQCAGRGYEVVRIPIVPGRDGRTYITYVNAIIDARPGRPVVYMPVYRHCEALNAAAAGVWRAAGYAVRRVDCTSCYAHFGSLRCLVNVLARRNDGPPAPGAETRSDLPGAARAN